MKAKNAIEAAGVLGFMGLMTAPWALAGLWLWFWFFVGVVVLLAVFEAVAYVREERTLSQLFWLWSQTHRGKAIALLGCLCAGWALMIWHLAAKLL